jgi:hypothetical protein
MLIFKYLNGALLAYEKEIDNKSDFWDKNAPEHHDGKGGER